MDSIGNLSKFEEKSIGLFYEEMIYILNLNCEAGKLWKINCFKIESTNLTIKYHGCHCYTKVCSECKKLLEKYKVEYFYLRMNLFEKRLFEFRRSINYLNETFN